VNDTSVNVNGTTTNSTSNTTTPTNSTSNTTTVVIPPVDPVVPFNPYPDDNDIRIGRGANVLPRGFFKSFDLNL